MIGIILRRKTSLDHSSEQLTLPKSEIARERDTEEELTAIDALLPAEASGTKGRCPDWEGEHSGSIARSINDKELRHGVEDSHAIRRRIIT